MARSKWWKPRQEGEATNVYLARVLRAVRLHDMADRALLYHFDDYFCPPDVDDGMNMIRLVTELRQEAGRAKTVRRGEIEAVRDAVVEGEFDGTKAESDRWAASPQGRSVMEEFPPDVRRKLFGI